MLIRSFCHKYQQFRSDSSIAHSLREKVNQLPPIPIHPEGYLQEWQGPVLENDIGHRHVSHLVGFFPDDFAFSLGPDYVEAGKKPCTGELLMEATLPAGIVHGLSTYLLAFKSQDMFANI